MRGALGNFGVLFGGYGNLKGLFWRVKTSVCGAVGNSKSAFREIWKLREWSLRVWKLGILAHEKLSVCNRGLVELRVRSVVVLCCSVVGCGRWVVGIVVVLLFRFSGNSVAFVGVVEPLF